MRGSDEEILVGLGRGLARERLEQNLTQARLAEEAGVSLATVRRLEAGHSVQLANWIRILGALGLEGRLDLLVPERAVSPLQQLAPLKQRRRASSKPLPAIPGTSWTWGEDR